MKLLTNEIRAAFPEWQSTDGLPPESTPIVAKFFDPTGSWTWYATEFDGEDTFFGYVDGFDSELGYFSLHELEQAKGVLGLGIERDLHFSGRTLADVMR